MNNEKPTNELDPKIALALHDVTEARALFAALRLSHEQNGSMSQTLQSMLALRLGAIQDRLNTIIDTHDIPF